MKGLFRISRSLYQYFAGRNDRTIIIEILSNTCTIFFFN